MRSDALEEADDVVDERHEVGEHDEIERLAEVETLAGSALEAQVRMAGARELGHARADVDSHTHGRLECSEEVSRAGPDLEHAAPGRYLEPVELADEPVVGAVAAAPALVRGSERVEEGGEVLVRGLRRVIRRLFGACRTFGLALHR